MKRKETPIKRISKMETLFNSLQDKFNELDKKYETIILSINSIDNEIKDINQKIQSMNDIEFKNGNGRLFKMPRNEFFQMIYDRVQVRYILNNLSKVMAFTLTFLLILNLLITLFFKK